MKQPQLEKEIRALQSDIYQLAKKTSSYSHGEILKLSQKLDQKLFVTKSFLTIPNKSRVGLSLAIPKYHKPTDKTDVFYSQ